MAGRMDNSYVDDDDYFKNVVEANEDLQGFILAPDASIFGSSAASAAMPIQRRARESKENNQIMKEYVSAHINQNMGKVINWEAILNLLREQKGIEITKKALREKWVNYLNPELYDGQFSEEELNILRDLYLESLRTKHPSSLTGYYPLPHDLKWAYVINMLAQYTPKKRGENPVKNKFNNSQRFWSEGHNPALNSDVDDDGGGGDVDDDGVVVDMDHDIAGSPEFSPEPLGSSSPAFGQSAFSVSPQRQGGKSSRKTSMKSHRKSSRKSYRKSSRKAHRKSSRKAHRKSSRKAKSG